MFVGSLPEAGTQVSSRLIDVYLYLLLWANCLLLVLFCLVWLKAVRIVVGFRGEVHTADWKMQVPAAEKPELSMAQNSTAIVSDSAVHSTTFFLEFSSIVKS